MLERAFLLWEKGRPRDAFPLFLKAARLGESTAQHNVAYFYDVGDGIGKNWKKALYWYKKAWRSGRQTDSCSNIARLYVEIGTERKAIFWWRKAIAHGDGDSALELAQFFMKDKDKRHQMSIVPLLKCAISSPVRFKISEAGQREAVRLLKRFERQSPRVARRSGQGKKEGWKRR